MRAAVLLCALLWSLVDSQTAPPTNVMAVQDGPRGIRVTWTPSSDANGYIISYTDSSSRTSVTVSDGSTDSHTLTGLQNGATYTISIVATSETSLHSESVEADMTVSLVPARPSINTNPPTTATSIFLSWSVADSVVTSSVVSWQRDISGECRDDVDEDSTPVTGSSTSTTITGRQEDSRYFITVTAFNDAGSSEESNTVPAVTMEAAPSAAPTPVSATSTSTTITVQWGPVECIHHNGVITGYSVQYTGGESTQTMSAPGDSSGGSYEITGLEPSTTYSIQVAAVTGTSRIGPYSSTITEVTSGGITLSVDSISTRSVIISWSLDDEGVTATSYTISYENTDTDCFTMTYEDIATSEMTDELTGLEEGTEYSITVTATLTGGGGTISDTQTATTMSTAPSAPPDSVRLSIVSSTAITVQWEMVPCIHRNGDITGYSVQYTGGGSIQTMSVSGGDATMTTIEGLRPSTTYSIVMAAVNDAGTGDYSDSMIIQTLQSVFLKLGSEVIPNHGYVVISDIGTSGTDDDSVLLCITDGDANTGDMNTEGNWFAPDGTRVNRDDVPGVRRNRGGDMVVRLFRNIATDNRPPAEGIYHCMVQDATPVFRTVYVGLYDSGGGVVDVQSVTFSLNDVASPQFTLTCISTGGPATTVTWTRDSQTAVGERRSEVVNGETAEYKNTLTVIERLGGLYTCTVANEVSSEDSDGFTVEVASAPTDVMAEQEGPDGIRVSWTPSGDANGYIIFYDNGAGSSDIVTVDGSSLTLTGLQNGATYTVSIVATSQHLPSDAVERRIMLVPPPSMPTVDTETAELESTTISLSWTVPEDSVVTNSLVMWEIASSGGSSARAVRDDGSGSSPRITGTSYTITGLRSSTSYLITVTLINPAGNSSMQITLSTTEGSDDTRGAQTDTAAVIGGVVVAIVFVSLGIIVIVVLVLRSRRGQHTTGPSKREAMPPPGTTNTMELSKFSGEPIEAMHPPGATNTPELKFSGEPIHPDAVRTSSNEAYRSVSQTGGSENVYEVTDPQTVPPTITQSFQLPAANECELV